jgi:hypothetical protein
MQDATIERSSERMRFLQYYFLFSSLVTIVLFGFFLLNAPNKMREESERKKQARERESRQMTLGL